MTQSDDRRDHRIDAGSVLWPRTPDDLRSSQHCPACFTPLRTAVCAHCGLDLNHPASTELLALSTAAADALDGRLEVIGRIRFETAAALRARFETSAAPPVGATLKGAVNASADTAPSAIVRRLTVTSPPEDAGIEVPPPVSPGLEVPSPPTAPARRVSSVQLALLVVGVSALSIGAIFFLVYAFINYGIAWRSVIIGAITVAAFAVAGLLRRRRLRATAEGIAAFAVVLVYLDAFAVRANDFFDSAAVDGSLFWGVTLVLSAVGFVLWHRLSGLRVPSIAGFTALAPGVGLVVDAAAAEATDGVHAFLVCAAMAVAGLAHRLAWRHPTASDGGFSGRTERAILLVTALLSVAAGSIAALAIATQDAIATEDDGAAAPVLAFIGLGVISAAHIGVLRSFRVSPAGARVYASLFGGALGIALAFTGFAGILPRAILGGLLLGADFSLAVLVPCVTAVAVTLALEAAARRLPDAFLRMAARVAAWSALVVAAVALLIPIAIAAVVTTALAARSALADAWLVEAGDTVAEYFDEFGAAILALAIVGVLAAVAWALGRVILRRAGLLAWFGAVVLILGAPLLQTLSLILVAWFLLAVGALGTLVLLRQRGGVLDALRPPLFGVLVAGTVLGWSTAWASTSTWAVAAGAAIAIVVATRVVVAGSGARAALLGTATVLLLIAGATTARQLTYSGALAPSWWTADSARFTEIVAIALICFAALPLGRVASDLERRTVFWISIVAAAGTAAWLRFAEPGAPMLVPGPGASLVVDTLLLVSLLLWVAPRSTQGFRIERITASVALGPVVYLVVDSFTLLVELPEFARSVAPATAALLTSAGALAVTMLRPSAIPRVVRELGVALVAIPAVLVAVAGGEDAVWLVLLITGVTALLLAISADGLFASASPRRHLGWVALALAVAGLWWRLADETVRDIEPYVLPLAGALLVVAYLIQRAARRRGAAHSGHATPTTSRAAPLVALAGLLVAILPIGAAAVTGAPTRAIVVAAISAGLLLLGAIVIGSDRIRPYLDVAALAGAIGVIVVSVGRGTVIALDGPRGFELESWLAFAVAVLIIAGFGLTRPRSDDVQPLRLLASRVLAVIGLTSVIALEVGAIQTGDSAALRALGVTMLFSGIHVIAFLVDRAPFTRTIAWLSVAYAGLAVAVGIGSGALDPLETGTVPLALALLATGIVHLGDTPEARSWPWLGPGVTVLLLPSLIATVDDRPVWRLVAIGVVGIATIIIGVVRRLQAPFLIAGVIVLVHAFATFAPQIRAAYEALPWWLWLGVGGVILIVLAARYEHRLQNLRDVVLRISALR